MMQIYKKHLLYDRLNQKLLCIINNNLDQYLTRDGSEREPDTVVKKIRREIWNYR